jgi:hypothetical protein
VRVEFRRRSEGRHIECETLDGLRRGFSHVYAEGSQWNWVYAREILRLEVRKHQLHRNPIQGVIIAEFWMAWNRTAAMLVLKEVERFVNREVQMAVRNSQCIQVPGCAAMFENYVDEVTCHPKWAKHIKRPSLTSKCAEANSTK